MLELDDDWVWDFWTVEDTGDTPGATGLHHLFFLKAPRSLGDPDLRHLSASVGHAVSTDLVTWHRVADALGPQAAPAYDDLATWTGCVVRVDGDDGDDGDAWMMFTSGLSGVERGLVQRIGVSTSPDLTTWTRVPDVVVEADPRWYLRHPGPDGADHAEHWRDPWVVRDEHGTWHMYVTAQAHPAADAGGPPARGLGVVGHATSSDLRTWEVTAPLSEVGGRFDQLEVISVLQVDDRWVLVFSCLSPEMPGAAPGAGGIWSVPVAGPGARVDPARAVRLTNERLYVGKVLPQPGGGAVLLAFRNTDDDGAFHGGIIDPLPVVWDDAGTALRLDVGPDDPASVYVPSPPD